MDQAAGMEAIKEALMRRRAGMGGTPIGAQVSQPTRMTPGGNPAQPLQTPPQVAQGAGPIPTAQGQPQAKPQQQSAAIDDETRNMTKALMTRLLKYI